MKHSGVSAETSCVFVGLRIEAMRLETFRELRLSPLTLCPLPLVTLATTQSTAHISSLEQSGRSSLPDTHSNHNKAKAETLSHSLKVTSKLVTNRWAQSDCIVEARLSSRFREWVSLGIARSLVTCQALFTKDREAEEAMAPPYSL